jgi:hypothetical protein
MATSMHSGEERTRRSDKLGENLGKLTLLYPTQWGRWFGIREYVRNHDSEGA